MNNKHLTALLLLDLSKAFGSIEHNILPQKLRLIEVSKTTLEWFKSYLSDRRQFVRLVHQRSESRTITHGIPQGSILGPILFSIYINYLPSIPNSSSLESYVDDSKLFLSFVVKEMEDAGKRLNEDLCMVASWCCNTAFLLTLKRQSYLLWALVSYYLHYQKILMLHCLVKKFTRYLQLKILVLYYMSP